MVDQHGSRAKGARELNGRGKAAALIVVALIIGALFWAMEAVVQHNALQNCIDSGRRDCVPLTKP